jgi:hypothetical protein
MWHTWERIGMHKGVLAGKPEQKRPIGRHGCRWEDNLETDHRETGLGVMDCIHLAQDSDQWRPLVNSVINLES